uniref:Uncharacterized protein n=1 Tax=Ciona intestinalis TaxID=7719 RepID=F6RB28_CIOIN
MTWRYRSSLEMFNSVHSLLVNLSTLNNNIQPTFTFLLKILHRYRIHCLRRAPKSTVSLGGQTKSTV